MKGPFATKDEAYAVAKPGEVVMARDTFHWRDECWCVMDDKEATRETNSIFSSWVVWEEVK